MRELLWVFVFVFIPPQSLPCACTTNQIKRQNRSVLFWRFILLLRSFLTVHHSTHYLSSITTDIKKMVTENDTWCEEGTTRFWCGQWGSATWQVKLMCGFCTRHSIDEVPDPYYGGPAGFEKVISHTYDTNRVLKPTNWSMVGGLWPRLYVNSLFVNRWGAIYYCYGINYQWPRLYVYSLQQVGAFYGHNHVSNRCGKAVAIR